MGGLSPGTAHVYPLQRRPSVAHSAVNHSTKLPVRGLGASVPRCRKLHPSPTSFSLCFFFFFCCASSIKLRSSPAFPIPQVFLPFIPSLSLNPCCFTSSFCSLRPCWFHRIFRPHCYSFALSPHLSLSLS